ncbi:cyclic GMP-AMP synthase DncV-like nucleotidyltransferase [Roseixanthobacter glucoisosaccharinicivorans]|uniref:cyclic GMP-AMP synthase DncV-like nucleotidyltransferase n=1 Tax=Roseixanthobacter glucoisosaccharinicivorans TaxID=3119923 RepID=UPI0037264734
MYNCANDVLAFHDDEVTLPQAERTNMRGRRDANRERLKKGLKDKGKPTPREFASQGSYAMKTMTRHPAKDYDIDDGVYFDKAVLIGERGAEMTALQARQMVRDALDDGSFKTPPEVRKNCVRVYYLAGYCVDVPVYRRVTTKDIFGNESYHHELASSDWKRSDARDVSKWFEDENTKQSPDTVNGRQLRRVVREIKKYARSRESWSSQVLSGFGITKLVTECFRGDIWREDRALYDTMKAIRDRLSWNLVVEHPVTPNETITKGTDDPRARFLRTRLTDAIDTLAPLFEHDCTRTKALKCWDKVYATTFFSDRDESKFEKKSALLKVASVAPPAGAFTFPNAPRADDKPRGFG